MSCGNVAANDAVTISEDGTYSLNDRLRDRILTCASGVLYRDITAAKLSCRQASKYYLYSQKIRSFVKGTWLIRILVDSQHEAIAIDSSNHWRDVEDWMDKMADRKKELTSPTNRGTGAIQKQKD